MGVMGSWACIASIDHQLASTPPRHVRAQRACSVTGRRSRNDTCRQLGDRNMGYTTSTAAVIGSVATTASLPT
jgi:hypothetical protein